ncbi:MAG: ribosome small subunit-dependent GTPase A [Clostridia bacterium]|nr:ribosome small subunit-dependent GTPase A [Clostridia bacterium]
MMERGILLKGIGSFYEVLTESGETVTSKARGSFRREGIVPTVGDRVVIERKEQGYAQLSEILPRRNLLVRPPVANVDQLLIVVSASVPAPDWLLVDRLIISAKRIGIEPVPVLNKIDVADAAILETFLSDYHAFHTLTVSAETGDGLDALNERLRGKVTCFSGQSAVGKSSLLNALIPALRLETGELSRKTERGRHTTRHAELWPYENGAVLDTPGFSMFETECLEQSELDACYPEFSDAAPCRFPGCMHLSEPDCGVKPLLETGALTKGRYERYREIALDYQMRRKHRYD